jgi:hypothetical protein
MKSISNLVYWLVKIVAAVIMLQTLFFKFSAAPESVYIFSVLNLEPYGRIGTGIIELFAGILILIPKTSVYGAILGLSTMMGAIFSHLFVLGINVQNDGGKLFILGVITAICCLIIIFKNKDVLLQLVARFYARKN